VLQRNTQQLLLVTELKAEAEISAESLASLQHSDTICGTVAINAGVALVTHYISVQQFVYLHTLQFTAALTRLLVLLCLHQSSGIGYQRWTNVNL
jgi:hypothetical protein